MLEGNGSLKKLSLSGVGLTPSGVEALADALEQNTGLEALELANNNLGDDGMSALARAFEVRGPACREPACRT